MNRLFNPFRYIAGLKSLAFGAIFIIAAALMLYSGGMIQDSYIHVGYADASFWYVLAMQVVWWLFPALLLYLCGLLLTKSKIRLIDILGTTAFAQLIMLLLIAPMLLPVVADSTAQLMAALQSSTTPQNGDMIPLLIYGIWTLACLALYYLWNYNAFAVSCNVSGWKAVVAFIVVQIAVTLA